jgi:hypothetical protein
VAFGQSAVSQSTTLALGATVIDQQRHAIATSAAAFGAVNVQRIELADEITKYDCTVAGHRLFSD